MPSSAPPDESRIRELLLHGVARHRAGQFAEAERAYREILALDPQQATALAHLGLLAHDLGQLDAAERLLARAIEIQPGLAEAHFHLGNLYRAQHRLAQAEQCYRTAVHLAPSYVEAHNNLGYTLARLDRPADAAASFHAALAVDPGHDGALTNLGNLLREQGRADEALPFLKAVVEKNAGSAAAHNNLGNVHKDLGQLDAAIDQYRQAIALAPRAAEVHSNLGIVLQKLGDPAGAIASFRRALERRPNSPSAYRNLLSALLFDPATTPDDLQAEHQRFGSAFQRTPPTTRWSNSPDPGRRLRLGFVSSDFHDHPVTRNLLPILGHLDRAAFEVILYSTNRAADGVTAQMRGLADGWRQLANESDADAAARIRADEIDILFLLAGRFDRNRPLIATYHAAPVQISLFDAATSGLSAMQYFISDRYMTPRGTGERFVERVLCLPHFFVHPPLVAAPPVGPAPFRRNGYITFGSCNKPSKLNDTVLRTWAAVLREVPASRLLLKYRNQFLSPTVRARVTSIFADAGIDTDRVQMGGETESFSNHLRTYDAIDIALDSFPFNGSTTTFEALWMGAPVVTLAGRTFMSRWTGAMLHALKLDELIADSREAYVRIAADLAGRPAALESLRRDLRQRVEASPLCDGPARGRQIGRLLRAVWRRWCAQCAGA